MKVGLFFGSFNPVHTGHLIIANHILNQTALQKIWFVVSPQNPLKQYNLLDEELRFDLVKLAIGDDERFEASDVEFEMPRPSYTIETLNYIKKSRPDNDYYLILGSDNFKNLSAWKSYDLIIRTWNIIVYERPGHMIEKKIDHLNVEVINPILIDISSTQIRKLLNEGSSIRYLVPDAVFRKIMGENLYQ